MLSFSEYDVLKEEKIQHHTGSFFDLDNTLFDTEHPQLRVHVLNSSGQRVKTLSNSEFNNHELPKDHSYDFSEYANSTLFHDTAKPIKRIMNTLKNARKNKEKCSIVTARQDMDNQSKFAHCMNKYGIDIDNDVHVHRIGNEKGNIADLKAKKIQNEIYKNGYSKVNMYDDDFRNIDKFLKLKKQHPEIEFHGHHVNHDPETGKTTIKHIKAD